ncbi:HAD family hydrolase [Tistrella mobilis]|uniref:phosphoglycolate phosphatase n=1 Tax=Tistrella mobilis (strain KA081020-065) TaxID=1110502 RepID=I3TKE7_TISMK|nr:HAD family hydrolase [Tistrella mobilis]AFK53235.1 phosphatase [Tistrella mobilis KA081020-065]
MTIGAERPRIEAILFDKDGTLVDFDASWGPVNRRVAERLARGDLRLAHRLLEAAGHDPETDRVLPGSLFAMGDSISLARTWSPFLPGQPDALRLSREIDRMFVSFGAGAAQPVCDLPALFGALRAGGLRLGIATNDSAAGAEALVAQCGLHAHLDFVAGYDSGHGAKPGPGMLTAFAATIGRPASVVAVVGDSLHDVALARAGGAGLAVVVKGGARIDPTVAAAADLVLDRLEDVTGLVPKLAAG